VSSTPPILSFHLRIIFYQGRRGLLRVCAVYSSRGSGDRVMRTKADAVLSPMHRDRKGGLGQPPGTSARAGTEES